jgi:hypothetical protein
MILVFLVLEIVLSCKEGAGEVRKGSTVKFYPIPLSTIIAHHPL